LGSRFRGCSGLPFWLVRRTLNVGFKNVPEFASASCDKASLEAVLNALEEQLALLDAKGARIAAAHVSAAVEHLRLDLLNEQIFGTTTH
jgi:hypothetical protein